MPCSFELDQERRLVVSRGWGVLTGEEMLEHQGHLAKDQGFHEDFSQLLDFTGVSQIQVDAEMVQHLAIRKLFSARSRRAFVVNSTTALGLTRMFEAYHELAGGQEQIRIFADRNEALQWLLRGQAAAHA